MYIFLAIISTVLLPVVLILMSLPEIRRIYGTIKLDAFVEIMTDLFQCGDLDKARKMCVATKNCLAADTVMLLIDAKSKTEMDIAVQRAKLSAQIGLEAAKAFSMVRTARNLIVLGVPFLIMSADGWKEGWVIAPLTISLLVSCALVLFFRGSRATVIAYNSGLPAALDEIYGMLLPIRRQQATVELQQALSGPQVTGLLNNGDINGANNVLVEYITAQLTK